MPRTIRTALCAAATVVCAAFSLPATAAQAAEETPRNPVVRGGDTLHAAGGVACTVGFNVRRGTLYYALLPPSCVNLATTWYADPALTVPAGSRVASTTQVGVVQYTNPAVSHPGEVNLLNGTTVDITAAGTPASGQPYCHVGQVSGQRCGTWGTAASACSTPGDLGGPAFSGTTALGLIARNNGVCPTGTTTYWPISVINQFGLSVY
ncbi:S1 family peptidase [Streptomyces yaizuensis]|uniref:S1 family peptidase n=1 Tax=Streptomyces yaizuensis TaxID=2989713 RepID=A0ABQ5NS11_9ACTN|nr:S1 family peptidase [Streptomyces sp. YSPA8]GLF93162.1 S1 family peptidase [Streptomyces sp. YSPA8]